MKKIALLSCLAVLASCGRSAPPDSVDSLVAHPDRLREVEQVCKGNYTKAGAAECNAAAEAQRYLFMGDGKTHYTPPKESPKF